MKVGLQPAVLRWLQCDMTRTPMFCQTHRHKEWEYGRGRE